MLTQCVLTLLAQLPALIRPSQNSWPISLSECVAWHLIFGLESMP